MKPSRADLELFRQFDGCAIAEAGPSVTVTVPLTSVEQVGRPLFEALRRQAVTRGWACESTEADGAVAMVFMLREK